MLVCLGMNLNTLRPQLSLLRSLDDCNTNWLNTSQNTVSSEASYLHQLGKSVKTKCEKTMCKFIAIFLIFYH